MADGDVTNSRGEKVGVLGGGQVTAGEGQHLGVGYPLARGVDLAVPVRVLLAAAHVQPDRAVQLTRDSGEIPALRVAAVFTHKPGGVVQERRTVAAQNR